MNTTRGTAAALIAAAGIALAACGGSAALSTACKSAIAKEKVVVGGNNRAVAALNVPTVAVPALWREDQRAVKAVTATCPSSVKVLLPT